MTGPIAPTGLTPAPALRPRSVGEMLDVSFSIYRRYFSPLAVTVLICSVVPMAFGAYLLASGGMPTHLRLAFLYLIAMMALSAIAAGAAVFIVSEGYLGRTITAGDALRRAAPLLPSLIICSLLLLFVVMMGMVMLIVPGIIFACGLAFAIPALVLEPRLTPSAALSRSWELAKGHKWRIWGLLVTTMILIYIPAAAIEGLVRFAMPSDESPLGVDRLGAALAGSLVQMFLYPFLYCVLTVGYYDLRVRKEGFDLELLASSLHAR